jgi:hypothetical protein
MLIRERKRKLEVLRAAAASTGRVHEDLAVNLRPDLAAVRTGAADVVKFQEQIASMERENEELAKEVSAVLESPELASALADPLARADVASGIPDEIGEELLRFCAAYIPTTAYMDMAISCSQQGTGDLVIGTAAAQLARQLKAVEVQRDQALGEKDRTIRALQRELASARSEAASKAALAQKYEAALARTESERDALRKSEKDALARLDQVTASEASKNEKVASLEGLVDDEFRQRAELQDNNRKLADANANLREENQRLQGRCETTESAKQRLSSALEMREKEVDGLSLSLEKKEDEIRQHSQRLQAMQDLADKVDSVQLQLSEEASAHSASKQELSSRIASLDKEKAALARSLDATCSYLRSQAVAKGSLKADLAAEKEHSQTALDSLAHFFAHSVTLDVPGDKWIAFARAVHTPRPRRANGTPPPGSADQPPWRYPGGPAPEPWVLDVWDVDDEPGPVTDTDSLTQLTVDLYAAFCARSWSARLCRQISQFTALVVQLDSVNTAVMDLLSAEAVQAAKTLDATPTAYICGLGIFQILVALQARWPVSMDPDVARDLGRHLKSALTLPLVDLIVDRDMAEIESPDRLDLGQTLLFSRPDSSVGFIVDKDLQRLLAVHKTRCSWASKVTASVRSPEGQGMAIDIDSDTTFEWLFSHWVRTC